MGWLREETAASASPSTSNAHMLTRSAPPQPLPRAKHKVKEDSATHTQSPKHHRLVMRQKPKLILVPQHRQVNQEVQDDAAVEEPRRQARILDPNLPVQQVNLVKNMVNREVNHQRELSEIKPHRQRRQPQARKQCRRLRCNRRDLPPRINHRKRIVRKPQAENQRIISPVIWDEPCQHRHNQDADHPHNRMKLHLRLDCLPCLSPRLRAAIKSDSAHLNPSLQPNQSFCHPPPPEECS